MHILEIMLSKGQGGAERIFRDTVLGIAEQGELVTAVCDPKWVDAPRLARQPNVTVITLPTGNHLSPIALLRLMRTVKRIKPDIIHSHLSRATLLGGLCSRLTNTPAIATTHNIIKAKYTLFIPNFIVTTVAQRQHLLQMNKKSTTIHVIPNFSTVVPASEPVRPSPTDPTFVSLGRFVHKKGFDNLIRAFAIYYQAKGDGKLLLAGGGPEETALRSLAESLGVGPRVIFRGWTQDPAAFLNEGDLFVLPSREEPFGVVMLEGMASGLPIIATDCDGPTEILSNRTGYLCQKNCPESLAQAMMEAANYPDEAHTRAKHALANYRGLYYYPNVIVTIRDVLAAIARGRV